MDFREADRRYAELRRQLDTGSISNNEFDAQRQQLIVEDDRGRLWVKSGETGEWHYRDGNAWTRSNPPGYHPLQAPAAQSNPNRRSQPQGGQQQVPSMDSASTHDGEGGRRPRDILYVVILTAGILIAAGVMLWRPVPSVQDKGGASPEEASGPPPGYTLFEDDSGALSVEVPTEWDQHIAVDSEGEKGRAAWSSYLGKDENVGPSLTAVNDLYSWRYGTPGHQGLYMVASKSLAQKYTDDELITLGPNDYSSSCKEGTPQDFDRPPYSGRILHWTDCAGNSEHTAITLAAAPKGRECVVVAQVGGYLQTQTDQERVQHALDTFKADCSKID